MFLPINPWALYKKNKKKDIDEFEYYFRFRESQCANRKEVELKLKKQ